MKVFSWSDGFHRYTVATTSRVKAMAAWGTDRDLFREGVAQIVTDGPDVTAALASPDVVIRRIESGLQAAVEKLPSAAKAQPSALAVLKRELTAARRARDMAERQHRQAERELVQRRAALEAEAAALTLSRTRQQGRQAAEIDRLQRRLAKLDG